MTSKLLNGKWKIRWCDGQRGGMPHYVKNEGDVLDADLKGLSKSITDQYDEKKWIDAIVPGEIHLDLLHAGLIDDPYTSLGALQCRWVEEGMWYYRTVFDAKEAALARYVTLNFEGVDYGTIVYLNGEEIARHANTFYPLVIDVSGKLKPVGNVLVVRVESGLYTVAEKKITHLYSATMSVDNLLHKRMWLRKPQSSTEWDWSPRLLNVGIFKDVFLSYDEDVIVSQTSVRSNTKADLSEASCEVRLFLSKYDPQKTYTVKLTIDGNTTQFQTNHITDNTICVCATVNNPELWYPIGCGDQRLYSTDIALYCEDRCVYTATKQVGFRTFSVDQSPHPDGGNYFNLIVNGKRVFAKGGNFVPMDMITVAATRKKYESIINLAIEANCNFFRVWGGGVYETDDFYELCDQKGIMVWQEFIAACGTIPFDCPEFAEDIQKEIRYQLRRLSCHPSLLVWCGNNEIDVIGVEHFTGQKPVDAEWYHEILPEIVKEEDPEKYYQPTSPWSFDGSSASNDTVGDQHPWSLGFADKDFRKYRDMVCRFPNEGGMLGPTSLATIKRTLKPEERKLHSFAWDFHDNMLENWMPKTSADYMVQFWTGINPNNMEFEDMIYTSGFVHGEGLKEYIDAFRSKKYTCGSAIFWMYNDAWPCTRSWTIVDYYHNRTPAFYPVKRAFTPVRCVIVDSGENLLFVGINDFDADFSGVLRYGAIRCDGAILFDQTEKTVIKKDAAHSLMHLKKNSCAIDGIQTIPFALLYDENGVLISGTRLINGTYNELTLADHPIQVEMHDSIATFSSDILTLGVCIDLDGEVAYSDNMFDLLPGIPYSIPWTRKEPPKIINTMNSIMHKYGAILA